MSGGSFNYLCFAGFSDIHKHQEDICCMYMRLRDFNGTDGVCDKIDELRSHMKHIDNILDDIRPVMEAVEWLDSGDHSEEDVLESIEAYNSKPHPLAYPPASANRKNVEDLV